MLNEMTPKIEAVQKMQDYIATHQIEEINFLSGNLKRNMILLLLVTNGIKKIHESSLNHMENATI